MRISGHQEWFVVSTASWDVLLTDTSRELEKLTLIDPFFSCHNLWRVGHSWTYLHNLLHICIYFSNNCYTQLLLRLTILYSENTIASVTSLQLTARWNETKNAHYQRYTHVSCLPSIMTTVINVRVINFHRFAIKSSKNYTWELCLCLHTTSRHMK